MPEEYRGKFIAQLHNALSGYTGLDVDEAVRYVVNRRFIRVSNSRPSLLQVLGAEQIKSYWHHH